MFDKDQGVLLFFAGGGFAERLAVCAYTLRQHWSGPISILATPAGSLYATLVAKAAGADVIDLPNPAARRNGHYLLKASLWRYSPYKRNLLIDLDTVICGPVDELLATPRRDDPTRPAPLVLTNFGGWLTTGKRMNRRVRGVIAMTDAPLIQRLALEAASECYPAINTGVVVWDDSPTTAADLAVWEETVRQLGPKFIVDELAMQIVYPTWNDRCAVVDDRWNCSPYHGQNRAEARIWHFHGDKHLKKVQGAELWWPAFRAAYKADFAGLQNWAGMTDLDVRAWLTKGGIDHEAADLFAIVNGPAPGGDAIAGR